MGTTTSTSSTSMSSTSLSSTSSSTSSTSSSISTSSTSASSISTSYSTSSTSASTSSTSSSISSTSSSISSTSLSSTSSSTSISSTSSSISSTSVSSTSLSSTSSSTSISSTSTSFSSTSSSVSSTSASTSSTSFSSTSSSSSTSTTTLPPPYITNTYQDGSTLPATGANALNTMNAYQASNVSVDDGDYFIEYGSEYMVQEYKRTNTNNTDSPTFTWRGRTTYDTRVSPTLIQIYNYGVASGSLIADSYSETNRDGGNSIGGTTQNIGQSFTGNGEKLNSAQFFLYNDIPTPSGTVCHVDVYAHINTFGVNSAPGSLLASSDNVSVNQLSSSGYALANFNFSGANQITLVNGTKYLVVFSFADPALHPKIRVGIDTSSPTHPGNYWDDNSGSGAGTDVCFYVFTGFWETLAVINKVPADTDFSVTVSQTANVSNYYDSTNTVTFRTYQQVI